MAIQPFLAMTEAEIGASAILPSKIAWMACHFSPYGTGLSNLPRQLPSGSLLILDDMTPIRGHDPEEIGAQLTQWAEAMECIGVLLDFQRPNCEETGALAKYLSTALPCPVGVSEPYAAGLDCPVFLPPVPLDMPLGEYTAPWSGRELWLDISLEGLILSLTEAGASTALLPSRAVLPDGHSESDLHCHYHAELTDREARFTLWRTPEDLEALLEKAENTGIQKAVGLFQELKGLSFLERGI